MKKADPSNEEGVLWTGQPSQVKNLGIYILCFFGSFLIVPVFYALWKYLYTHYTIYTVSAERVFIRTGIFDQKIEEVELYRIKDYNLMKPFFLRIFYLSNLSFNTSDNTLPLISFEAISQGGKVRNTIRKRVEILRTVKNIREVDFNS